MAHTSTSGGTRWLVWTVGALLLIAYAGVFGAFFPNRQGGLGHDHDYFYPLLLAGAYWARSSGLAVPWFTPGMCGGVPFFANPQNPYYSALQLFTFLVDPVRAVWWTVLLFAALGFAGMYLLLARGFRVAVPLALFGAAAFMWNGFFIHRMIIGHLAFHPFMLAPLLAYLCIRTPERGKSRVQLALDIACGGLVVALFFYAGMVHLILPVVLATTALGLLHGLGGGERVRFWIRLAGSLALGTVVSLAKLVAGLSLLKVVPRGGYPLPGVASWWDALILPLRTLALGGDGVSGEELVNRMWNVDRHELEYSVTPVPWLLLLGAAGLWLWRRRGRIPAPRPGLRLLEGVALLALLAAPVLVNFYSPGWNAFLKTLPVLKDSSLLVRWYCAYIPVVIVGAVLAVRALQPRQGLSWAIGVIGTVLVVGLQAGVDRSAYHAQGYPPEPAVEAHRKLAETGQVPVIERVTVDEPSDGVTALMRGVSAVPCYEPLFGYRLENLKLGALHTGPVDDVRDGWLNLKNPACYVFPAQNRCAPGDHFPAAALADLRAFAAYRPYPFAQSALQRLANWTSALSLLGVTGFGLGVLGSRALRKRETREVAKPGKRKSRRS